MRRLTILLLLAMMAIGQSMAKPVVMSSLAIPADTTRYGEDTEEDENGTATQGNTHVARDLMAIMLSTMIWKVAMCQLVKHS